MELLKIYQSDLEEIYNLKFVDAIIIFGSTSLNKNNSKSDLDICVITKENLISNKKQKILEFRDKKFDVNIFEDLNIPIKFKVFTEGKVYKTKINLNKIKSQTINEWFDFRPILNNIYKSKNLLEIM